MSKGFKVDARHWNRKSRDIIKALKIDEPKFVKEQAGLLAELAAKVAPPFKEFPKMKGSGYASSGSQGAGIGAVKAGFFSALERVGSIASWKDKKIKKAIRAGDTNYLEQRFKHFNKSVKHNLNVKDYTDRERDKKRNNRGRVTRGTQPFVGMTTKDVNAGLKRAVGNVGIAKASLAKIAVKLGRKNPPKWIARHFGKVRHTMTVTKNPSVIRFKTSAKGLDVVANNLKRIERFRLNAMEKRLESLLRANAKKAGFKVKKF